MKETVNAFDYAETFVKELSKGILLNVKADKFNSMVIGWGHLGILWGMPTVTVYVRQSRYTKAQLDKAGEFTISIPLGEAIPQEIWSAFGRRSGRDMDKAELVTLEEPRTIHTPGIKEVPLTLECKVLYSQDQVPSKIADKAREKFYSGVNAEDEHTAYVAEIVDAYLIR